MRLDALAMLLAGILADAMAGLLIPDPLFYAIVIIAVIGFIVFVLWLLWQRERGFQEQERKESEL